MFERGTVFIVGAGASFELGLPLGETLMTHISGILQSEYGRFYDEVIQRVIGEVAQERAGINFGNELQRLATASQRVIEALPFAMSIDNLLDAHRHDENVVLMGKIAIARAILRAEQSSDLHKFLSPPKDPVPHIAEAATRFRKSWYVPLMRLLNAGLPLEQLTTIFDNVTFITFNYDRCLEHYLINGIMRYYGVDVTKAQETMSSLRIVHVYGSVGSLPWSNGPDPVPFGGYDTPNLLSIARRIQTFTESAASDVVDQARQMIMSANTLVFMGFGFLPQNMELLRVPHAHASRAFMTTIGISDSDVPIVEEEMRSLLNKPRQVTNIGLLEDQIDLYVERGTCADLMRNHWLRLTR
jgi:hypothetical protein